MSDSLTYIDKCFVAALATMNASYLSREGNVRSASNAAIDTMKIKTLAEYYKGDPEKFKTYDPSKLDDNKLMRTYVIPLVLDNGETLDLIVNSKGQDMACVFLDEDSKEHQFQLTPRMKNEIMRNGINGIETKLNVSDFLEPKTLEEFKKEEEAAENTEVASETPETETTEPKEVASEKSVPAPTPVESTNVVTEKADEYDFEKYTVPSIKELKSKSYYVQIAVLSDKANIKAILDKYSSKYPITLVPMASGKATQVLVGPLSVDEYGTVLNRFKAYGYKDAFLRKIR